MTAGEKLDRVKITHLPQNSGGEGSEDDGETMAGDATAESADSSSCERLGELSRAGQERKEPQDFHQETKAAAPEGLPISPVSLKNDSRGALLSGEPISPTQPVESADEAGAGGGVYAQTPDVDTGAVVELDTWRRKSVNPLDSTKTSVSDIGVYAQTPDVDTGADDAVPLWELDVFGWDTSRSGLGRSVRFKYRDAEGKTRRRYHRWIREVDYAEFKRRFDWRSAVSRARKVAEFVEWKRRA